MVLVIDVKAFVLCLLQAKEKRQAKEAQVAKAQMDAARRGGVSWGMADEEALEEDLENVTEGAVKNTADVGLDICKPAFSQRAERTVMHKCNGKYGLHC